MNSHLWTMQESSGSVVADSAEDNHGTIDGSVTLGVAGPGGDFPLAAELDGSTVTPIALDATFTLSRKHDWSIKFWAKQASADQQGMILGDRNDPLSFVWLTSSFGGLVVRPANAAKLTGTNNGLDVVFTVPAATRTKWSEYELTHDVSGPTPQLSLHVDGELVATEDAAYGMELTINTIGAGHTSPTFSMDGQLAGVELSGTEIDYSKPDKVVLVAGQSNAEGRFDNPQDYEHLTQFASVYEGGQWSELIDTGSYGEVWPLLATRWLESRNESIGFIYAAVGGTGLVDTPDWAEGGATYNAAIAMVEASGVEKVDLIVWFQGERDANSNVQRADYLTAMEDLLARLHNDLPGSTPLVCGQINSVPTGTIDEIRNAQSDAWANEWIFPGPVTYDLGPLADDLHFTTDAEAVVLADRWWAAVDEALFDGTYGTPPRLVSAIADGLTITLTYDRELETAATYGASAWELIDNGTEISVSAATQINSRTVELTLSSRPSSSEKWLTVGPGSSAQGLEVPRGLANQPALPETFSVTVPAQHASANASVGTLVQVAKTQRILSVQ